MRCPSCLAIFHDSAEACPDCGFTLAKLDKKFGTVPKIYRHLTDMSAYFNKTERLNLEKKLPEIERQFSGLYISILTMEVFRLFSPREYLFWLLNRCIFSPLENRYEKSLCVVLFFDSLSKTVLLTTGYGLQTALPEEILSKLLEKAIPDFKKENFYDGTLAILSGLRLHLKNYAVTGKAQPIALSKPHEQGNLKPVEEMF